MPSHVRFALRVTRRLTVVAVAATVLATAAAVAQPSPTEAACGSFQGRVNNASTGSTITIPKCTFHESVVVNKRLTIKAHGATIDAGGAAHGIRIQANDVTIKGLHVRNASGGAHDGAIHTSGASRLTLDHVKVYDSATVCLSLNGGSGHRILHTGLKRCGKEGYFGNGLSNTLFRHVRIHDNNTNLAWNPQDEAGGGKIMASTNITFARNKVWDNGGPGIWFDNGVKNVVVKHNRVWNNHESGIMFEISDGARIYRNEVWRNGYGNAAWGFGPGILVSSSDNASVHHNTVAWNARGISVISQNRPTSPHKGNLIHDNVIVSATGSFVTGFYDDHGGSLFSASNGNRGWDDRYWVGTSQPSGDRFHWNGPRSTLSAYNSTPGEARGAYISKATRNKILRKHGMPLS
jgi:nitrous oxidase accessory protein NosD